MKLFICILSCLLALASYGKCQIFVLDSETNKPIKNTLLQATDYSYEYYSNNIGFVQVLDCDKRYTVFKEGYTTIVFDIKNNTDTIFLSKLNIELKEVVVNIKKMERIAIGTHKHSTLFRSTLHLKKDFIYAARVFDEGDSYQIINIHYPVRTNCTSARLGIYIFDSNQDDHAPSKVLFYADTTVFLKSKMVEISPVNLFIASSSNGIFNGITLLEKQPENCEFYLKLTNRENTISSFIKYQDNWKELILGVDDIWNIRQGITIEKNQ